MFHFFQFAFFPPLPFTFQSTKVTLLYAAIWADVGIMWSALLEASSAAAAGTAEAVAQSIKSQTSSQPSSVQDASPVKKFIFCLSFFVVLKIHIFIRLLGISNLYFLSTNID